jgi:hypothetical protein
MWVIDIWQVRRRSDASGEGGSGSEGGDPNRGPAQPKKRRARMPAISSDCSSEAKLLFVDGVTDLESKEGGRARLAQIVADEVARSGERMESEVVTQVHALAIKLLNQNRKKAGLGHVRKSTMIGPADPADASSAGATQKKRRGKKKPKATQAERDARKAQKTAAGEAEAVAKKAKQSTLDDMEEQVATTAAEMDAIMTTPASLGAGKGRLGELNQTLCSLNGDMLPISGPRARHIRATANAMSERAVLTCPEAAWARVTMASSTMLPSSLVSLDGASPTAAASDHKVEEVLKTKSKAKHVQASKAVPGMKGYMLYIRNEDDTATVSTSGVDGPTPGMMHELDLSFGGALASPAQVLVIGQNKNKTKTIARRKGPKFDESLERAVGEFRARSTSAPHTLEPSDRQRRQDAKQATELTASLKLAATRQVKIEEMGRVIAEQAKRLTVLQKCVNMVSSKAGDLSTM